MKTDKIKQMPELAPEGYVERATQLARALGLHPNTIRQHLKDPTHPQRVKGLGWNVSECRRWYELHGILKPGGAGEIMSKALMRKMVAEAGKEETRDKILKARLAREEGKLLPVEMVCESETEVFGETVSRFDAIPATIGPLVAGADAKEAERIIREAIRDALACLADLPWLPESEKKKVRLSSSEKTISVESFGLLPPTEVLPGSAATSDLTPPVPSPVISG